jgi:hypothetical protein
MIAYLTRVTYSKNKSHLPNLTTTSCPNFSWIYTYSFDIQIARSYEEECF